jgi:thioredoxin 1
MSSPNVVVLTKDNFDAQVLKSATPVLVDFWAPWCGPCKMIGPVLDDLSNEYAGKIIIGKINIDEQSELASQFRVSSIPTLLFFRGGQVINQMVGAKSRADLKKAMDAAIA